jgi:ribosomal protein S18 acetylase RimI-like enzyme
VPFGIRPAIRDDAEFLAWVMLAASRAHLRRGVWDLIIGADEAGCLDYLRRLAVAEPRSLCHYQSFLVAQVDGQPAAALCGFDMRGGGWATVAAAMANVQRDLGWTEADLSASHQRAGPAWSCFLPEAGADWGIESVATRPEFQRRGLAKALVDEIVREGAGRGCKIAQITTFIGNEAACSVYEKSGFKVSDEKRCAEFASVVGAPGFVRLLRAL